MELILTISGGILAGLIMVVFGLALIPLSLRVRLSSHEKWFKVRFWKMTLFDTAKPKPGEESRSFRQRKERQEGLPKESRERKRVFGQWNVLWRSIKAAPELAQAALMYVARVAGKVRLSGFQGTVGGGLADPADTGMAFGALYALAGAAPGLGEKLKMEPDYLAERIEYDLQGEVSLRPISLLGPTVKLIGKLPKRELIGILRENRKRRRKVAS